MSVRYMCDDCGEIIEQLRVAERREATAVTASQCHDRCLSCALRYLGELSESSFALEFVNPALKGVQSDGKVC